MSQHQPNLLYKAYLNALNVQVDNDLCYLLAFDGSGREPCIPPGDNRQWRVPTDGYLANPQWDKFLHFHPLCESTLRQESLAQKWLSRLIATRITTVLELQIDALLEIGSNVDIHKTLKGERHKVLSVLSNVTHNGKTQTLADWNKLRDKITITGEHRLYRMYIKKTGTWNDATYSRVAVSRFPLYEELISDSPTVFGIKLSNKTVRENLIKVFEYLLPGLEDSNTYNYGSSNMTAVNFHASAMGFAAIARALNKTTKLFSDFFDSSNRMEIALDWVPMMDQIGQWRDAYSIFDESAGESDANLEKDPKQNSFDPNRLTREVASTPLAPTHTSAGQQQTGSNFVTPVAKSSGGGVSVQDFLRGGQGKSQSNSMTNQQVNSGWNQAPVNNIQFNNLNNPMMAPQQPQTVVGASGLVRTVTNTGFNTGGFGFNSFGNNNGWGGRSI